MTDPFVQVVEDAVQCRVDEALEQDSARQYTENHGRVSPEKDVVYILGCTPRRHFRACVGSHA